MRRKHFVLIILGATLSLGILASRARAGTSLASLQRFSHSEIEFLMDNCGEFVRVVPSGTVVANGEIYDGMKVVSDSMGKVYVNGIQVIPQSDSPRVDTVQSRLAAEVFLRNQHSVSAPGDVAMGILQEAKKKGVIDYFQQITPKRGTAVVFEIGVNGHKAYVQAERPPSALLGRYVFLVQSIISVYAMKRERDGETTAKAWLESKMSALKKLGDVTDYAFPAKGEMDVTFSQTHFPWGFDLANWYGIPPGGSFVQTWQSKQLQTRPLMDELLAELRHDETVVFGKGFQTHAQTDKRVLSALKVMQAGGGDSANRQLVQKRFGLTDLQVEQLENELR